MYMYLSAAALVAAIMFRAGRNEHMLLLVRVHEVAFGHIIREPNPNSTQLTLNNSRTVQTLELELPQLNFL